MEKTTNSADRILGEKIKELRQEKGITQKDLAGGRITRNMLSLIENGHTSPSVSTLLYIAEKLEVPAGYFLTSNTADDELFYKMTVIDKLKNAFKAGEYEEVITISHEIPGSAADDEVELILAKSYMKTALGKVQEFMFTSAARDFDKASVHSAKSVYCSDMLKKSTLYYGELMRTAASEQITDLLCRPVYICEYVTPDVVEYFTALRALKSGKETGSSRITQGSPQAMHINSVVHMNGGNYAEAQKRLRELSLDSSLPFYMQYRVLCDLEFSANATGDLRLAYSSSRRRLELLDKIKNK